MPGKIKSAWEQCSHAPAYSAPLGWRVESLARPGQAPPSNQWSGSQTSPPSPSWSGIQTFPALPSQPWQPDFLLHLGLVVVTRELCTRTTDCLLAPPTIKPCCSSLFQPWRRSPHPFLVIFCPLPPFLLPLLLAGQDQSVGALGEHSLPW